MRCFISIISFDSDETFCESGRIFHSFMLSYVCGVCVCASKCDACTLFSQVLFTYYDFLNEFTQSFAITKCCNNAAKLCCCFILSQVFIQQKVNYEEISAVS